MPKDFDYEQFAQKMSEQCKAIIPQDFNDDDKYYIQKTVLNFASMAGEALCNDDSINFSNEQLEFAVQVIAEWTFRKACDLLTEGVDFQKCDSVLQKCAFYAFNVVKEGIIQNFSQERIMEIVQEHVTKGCEEALSEEDCNDSHYDDYFVTDDSDPVQKAEFKKKHLKVITETLDSTDDEKERETLLSHRAEFYQQLGMFDEAAADYTSLLEKEDNTYYLQERANCYQQKGRFEEAINDLKKVAELNKDFDFLGDDVSAKLGNCYKKIENWENAIKYYKKSLEDDSSSEVVFSAAQCYEHLDEPDKAIELFNNAIEDYPSNLYYAWRGIYYFKNKQYAKFEADFLHVLDSDADYKMKYFEAQNTDDMFVLLYPIIDYLKEQNNNPKLLAFFLKEAAFYNFISKDYEKALSKCNESIENNPDRETAYSIKIKTLLKLERTDEAKTLSDSRMEFILNNQDRVSDLGKLECYAARVDCLYTLGKIDESILLFSKIMTLSQKLEADNPDASWVVNEIIENYKEIDSDFAQRLISIQDEINNPETILNRLNLDIEENPDDADSYAARAEFYWSNEGGYNVREALKDYAKAIELNPNKANYYVERSWIYQGLDDKNSALADINKANELELENMNHLTSRASIYLSYKTPEYDLKAIEDYKTFLQTCTDSYFLNSYNQMIGQIYYKLEDYEKALIYLTKLTGQPSADLLLVIAKCYNQTNMYEKAFDYYIKCYVEGDGCYDFEQDMSYHDIVMKELKELAAKEPRLEEEIEQFTLQSKKEMDS